MLYELIFGNTDAMLAIAPVLLGALIGGGVGLAKSEFMDKPRFQAQLQSRAISNRYAPLKGERGPGFSDLQAPDQAQSALNFGLAGAMFGKQFGGAGKGGVKTPASEGLSAEQIVSEKQGLGPLSKEAAADEISQQLSFLKEKQDPSNYTGGVSTDPSKDLYQTQDMASFNMAQPQPSSLLPAGSEQPLWVQQRGAEQNLANFRRQKELDAISNSPRAILTFPRSK